MTRIAVVTGAARGIGAATARRLSSEGWRVIAVDRGADDPRLPYAMGTATQLAALAVECERVTAVVADATKEGVLRAALDELEGLDDGIDAFVASAGVIAGGVPLWEMPYPELAAVFDVNLGGVLAGARTGIPMLLRRDPPRAGRFIAVASAAASRGMPLIAAYSAAKAGVAGLVRGLAAELAGTGVTANAVSPGSTSTAILTESARLYGLASPEAFGAQQLVRRLLDPEEVAATIAWLAGEGGSAITGADIPVDGGLSV